MKNKLLLSVFALLFLLVVGDCVSTYYCLTTLNPNYKVWEGNPVTDWLFQQVGLVPGLVSLVVVKAAGLMYLSTLAKISRVYYWILLIGMSGAILTTGYINYNNWSIYYHILNS